MRCKPDFILTQPEYSFATYVRQTPPSHTISLKVPHIQMSKMPHMSDTEFDNIRGDMRGAYSTCMTSATLTHIIFTRPQDMTIKVTIQPEIASKGGYIDVDDVLISIPPGTKTGHRLLVNRKPLRQQQHWGPEDGHTYLDVKVLDLPDDPQKTGGQSGELDEWG